jgi:TPR repeat protein
MAQMLLSGQGVARDSTAALELAKPLAAEGNVQALLLVGDIYSDPASSTVDGPSAIKAYEQAALAGSSDALLRLGDMYRDGKGVPVDGQMAVQYYLKAGGAQ